MTVNTVSDFYDKVKYDDNFKSEIASVKEEIEKKVISEEIAQKKLNDIVTKYIKKYDLNLTFDDVVRNSRIDKLSTDDLEAVSGGVGSKEICSMFMATLAAASSISWVSNYVNKNESRASSPSNDTKTEVYNESGFSSDKSVESVIDKINSNTEENNSKLNEKINSNVEKNNSESEPKKEKNNVDSQNEVNELLKQIKALKQENDSLREENEQLRKNNNEYENQNQELRTQINDMYELISQLQALDSSQSTAETVQTDDAQTASENVVDEGVQTEEQDVSLEKDVQASKEDSTEIEIQATKQNVDAVEQNTRNVKEEVVEEKEKSEAQAKDSSKENKDDGSNSKKENNESEVQVQKKNEDGGQAAKTPPPPPPPPPPGRIPPPPPPPTLQTNPAWTTVVKLPSKPKDLSPNEKIPFNSRDYENAANAELIRCSLNVNLDLNGAKKDFFRSLFGEKWKALEKTTPSFKKSTEKSNDESKKKALKKDIANCRKKVTLYKKASSDSKVKDAIGKYQEAIKSIDENISKFNSSSGVYDWVNEIKKSNPGICEIYSQKMFLETCKKEILKGVEKSSENATAFFGIAASYGINSIEGANTAIEYIDDLLTKLNDELEKRKPEFDSVFKEFRGRLSEMQREKKELAEKINEAQKIKNSYNGCEILLNLDGEIAKAEEKLSECQKQLDKLNNKEKSVPKEKKTAVESTKKISTSGTKIVKTDAKADAKVIVKGEAKDETKKEAAKSKVGDSLEIKDEKAEKEKTEKEKADREKVSKAIKMGKEKGVFDKIVKEEDGAVFNNLLRRLKDHPNVPESVFYLESRYEKFFKKLNWNDLVSEFTDELVKLDSDMNKDKWDNMPPNQQHPLLIAVLDKLNEENK